MAKYEAEIGRLTDVEADDFNKVVSRARTVNEANRLMEDLLHLHQEIGWQTAKLGDIGMSAENTHRRFALMSGHTFLMDKALEPLTRLYEEVMGEMGDDNKD